VAARNLARAAADWQWAEANLQGRTVAGDEFPAGLRVSDGAAGLPGSAQRSSSDVSSSAVGAARRVGSEPRRLLLAIEQSAGTRRRAAAQASRHSPVPPSFVLALDDERSCADEPALPQFSLHNDGLETERGQHYQLRRTRLDGQAAAEARALWPLIEPAVLAEHALLVTEAATHRHPR